MKGDQVKRLLTNQNPRPILFGADTIAAWIPHLPPKTTAEDTGAIELPREFLTVRGLNRQGFLAQTYRQKLLRCLSGTGVFGYRGLSAASPRSCIR